MNYSKIEIETGTLLLAEPFMEDSNFKRASLLVCDHSDDDGTVGFILNKPLNIPLNDLLANFPEVTNHVFFGGPVQTDTIHYIHNCGDLLESSQEVCEGVWWGGNFDQLKSLMESKVILSESIRFFVGYSGWSPGQLRDELQLGSWVIGEMEDTYLFDADARSLWQTALSDKGSHFEVIANMPEKMNWS